MIETGDDVRRAREQMALSQYRLADLLRLGATTQKGAQHLRDVESGKRAVTGPLSLAVEALLSGWRPTP